MKIRSFQVRNLAFPEQQSGPVMPIDQGFADPFVPPLPRHYRAMFLFLLYYLSPANQGRQAPRSKSVNLSMYFDKCTSEMCGNRIV